MPRAGLSALAVVTAGAEIADESGWDGLTLAAVAQRSGVRLPSLYKHVAGIDALRRGIAVLALAELGDALATAAVGRSAAAALRAVGHAYRGYATARPGRYAATLAAPAPDDAEHLAAAARVVSIIVAVLDGYDLVGDAAIDAVRILRSGLHGFVALEAAGGFRLPQDVERSFDRLLDVLDAGLSRLAHDAPIASTVGGSSA